MKPRDYHIAELISCYLDSSAKAEQLKELEAWLQESESNRMLLESFKARRAVEDFEFMNKLSYENAWSGFKVKQRRTKFKRFYRIGGSVAASFLVFFLVFAALNFVPEATADTDAVFYTENQFINDVEPAKNRAVLELSTGRIVDLEKGLDLLREINGVLISGEDDGLVYSGNGYSSVSLLAQQRLLTNKLIVPKKGTYKVTLSDGTKVWLNAMSELHYPVVFDESKREVVLKGEAYFEVAHIKDSPFYVHVGNNKIEVLGTSFNVNAYNEVMSTTLIEGDVIVSSPSSSVKMKPGQEAVVSSDIILTQADLKKALAWKRGDFYFKSESMTSIMDELSRWYGVEVNFEGKYSKDLSFTGGVRRNVNISEVLEMLSYVSDAVFKIEGEEITIRFRPSS